MAAAATKALAKIEDAAVLKFREAYDEALAEARISAEHTATQGWQSLYAEQRKADRKERRRMAVDLKDLADRLEQRGWTVEDEKALGDLRKAAIEARERADVFDRETVEPVKRCVERCNRVIEDAKIAADRAESSAPLTSRGVADRIRDAIASVASVSWNAEKGLVVVR